MGHVLLHGRGWVRVALGQQELGREVGFEEREFFAVLLHKKGHGERRCQGNSSRGQWGTAKIATPGSGAPKAGCIPSTAQ